MKSMRSTLPLLSLVFTLGLMLGCQSTPKIDWNTRVGNYTYDDAVLEMGPPDRTALISDGRVAEWVVGYRSKPTFGVGVGSYGASGGVGVGTTTGGGPIENILRLTFDPSDTLTEWEHTERR